MDDDVVGKCADCKKEIKTPDFLYATDDITGDEVCLKCYNEAFGRDPS